jgi:hypothetical protein
MVCRTPHSLWSTAATDSARNLEISCPMSSGPILSANPIRVPSPKSLEFRRRSVGCFSRHERSAHTAPFCASYWCFGRRHINGLHCIVSQPQIVRRASSPVIRLVIRPCSCSSAAVSSDALSPTRYWSGSKRTTSLVSIATLRSSIVVRASPPAYAANNGRGRPLYNREAGKQC